MKPAEIVNNLGMLSFVIQSLPDEDDFKQVFLETIRTCQLMAMKLTIEEVKEIEKRMGEDVHI